MKQQGVYFTVEKIRDAYLGVKSKVQMVLTVFREHNAELRLRIGRDITAKGVQKYGRAIDNIFIERFWRNIKYEKIYLEPSDDGLELYDKIKSNLTLEDRCLKIGSI